jgi:hypothetical protein
MRLYFACFYPKACPNFGEAVGCSRKLARVSGKPSGVPESLRGIEAALALNMNFMAYREIFCFFLRKTCQDFQQPTGMIPKACPNFGEGTGTIPKASPNFGEGTGIIPKGSPKLKQPGGIKNRNLFKINHLPRKKIKPRITRIFTNKYIRVHSCNSWPINKKDPPFYRGI